MSPTISGFTPFQKPLNATPVSITSALSTAKPDSVRFSSNADTPQTEPKAETETSWLGSIYKTVSGWISAAYNGVVDFFKGIWEHLFGDDTPAVKPANSNGDAKAAAAAAQAKAPDATPPAPSAGNTVDGRNPDVEVGIPSGAKPEGTKTYVDDGELNLDEIRAHERNFSFYTTQAETQAAQQPDKAAHINGTLSARKALLEGSDTAAITQELAHVATILNGQRDDCLLLPKADSKIDSREYLGIIGYQALLNQKLLS